MLMAWNWKGLICIYIMSWAFLQKDTGGHSRISVNAWLTTITSNQQYRGQRSKPKSPLMPNKLIWFKWNTLRWLINIKCRWRTNLLSECCMNKTWLSPCGKIDSQWLNKPSKPPLRRLWSLTLWLWWWIFIFLCDNYEFESSCRWNCDSSSGCVCVCVCLFIQVCIRPFHWYILFTDLLVY